jgi:ubiquinone/menaquinone biosynthesis C-methylase UbiE
MRLRLPKAHGHHAPAEVSPEFLEHNKAYYLIKEKYDWVEATDNWRGLEAIFHTLRQRKVRQLVQQHAPTGPYLDAGCGTGLNLRHLPAGAVGVDINPRNLPPARIHAPNARLLQADLELLPFPDAAFATVICTEVLEHFPVPTLPLAEITRVLQPGGLLIGSVPAVSWVWNLRFLSSTCPAEEPYHKNYERHELEDLLAKFEVVKLQRAVFGMSWMYVVRKPWQ